MILENWNEQADKSNASQSIDFMRALGTTADLRNLNSKSIVPNDFPSAADFTGFNTNAPVDRSNNNVSEKATPSGARRQGSDRLPFGHDEKKQTGEIPNNDAGDKTKLQGTPEEQTQLDASRKRLKSDAASTISSPKDRDRFLHDMDALEERAKTQPLNAKEISATYDQLSKLLKANHGAVSKQDRILAAETFAHHMGDPTSFDQGNHNSCQATALAEHLTTRNPAKTAEIVATMALTGQWEAPDGKQIKITPASLIPGIEERNNPPNDGERSYATQLLTLALINDSEQRENPPKFYSQERPQGQGDTGERLKYADGTNVTKNDTLQNGDKTPWNQPDVSPTDIIREGRSINAEGNFFIANDKVVPYGDDVVRINSSGDLRSSLTTMKNSGKLPAVILVNANDAAFGGNPANGVDWHAVSITDFDQTKDTVHVVNQWGKDSKKDMSLIDLYRATQIPLVMPITGRSNSMPVR